VTIHSGTAHKTIVKNTDHDLIVSVVMDTFPEMNVQKNPVCNCDLDL